MKKVLYLFVLFVCISANILSQAIPKQINYQGILKDAAGNLVADNDYAMTFKIYNEPTAGTALWTEVQAVAVREGLFSVQLGSISPITTVPFDRDHYLGITLGTGSELSPRIMLTPSPYSFTSMNVLDNVISKEKLQNGAVTSDKIGSNQVVKSINTLKDSVTLVAGSNISIVPTGNNLTISAIGLGTGTISGSGTFNTIPMFTNSTTIGNSLITYSEPYIMVNSDLYIENNQNNFTGLTIGNADTGPQSSEGIYFANENGTVSGIRLFDASNPSYPSQMSIFNNRPDGSMVLSASGSALELGDVGGKATAKITGDLVVTGTLTKGAGAFKIDHPLDPQNKFLYHSFVESPDMMNIYNGNIVTDASGYATVILPDWFEALNKDFRYQLTVIGDFAQAIVSQKVQNNQFTIRTDKPSVEVSWQVTGIRHDTFAEKNRIPVEENKKGDEVGKYIYPDAFGVPEMMGVNMNKMRELDKSQ
jgi:hypothetical protein